MNLFEVINDFPRMWGLSARKKNSIDELDLFELEKEEFCRKYDVCGYEYDQLQKEFQEV